MKLNKKQGLFLKHTIEYWRQQGTITPDVAKDLNNSFSIRSFDWERLAKYSFWISMICAVIAIAAITLDDVLMNLIEKIFVDSKLIPCLIFAVVAAAFYLFAYRRRKTKPLHQFSNEAIIFGGVLSTAVAVAYFGQAIDTGSGHFSLLFLLSTIIYAALAFWFPSKLIWVFSLLSLGSWFGTETGYMSGWGAYYLGMNYPLRFVVFGGALIGLSLLFKRHVRFSDFAHSTYVMGLLYLFIALWILSIFGNYGDLNSWYHVKQYELLHWGILFAFVAIIAIVYGLKHDDATSRGFGITFLFLNLYTKYFEFFWNGMHKAIFFILLAVSFWWIGRHAEKLWNLEFLSSSPQNKNH
ncbi:DUF2157 domain-containing protein [Acinetobacter sp. VNH17]|uniref:DUF2157 domain-containing protein n=1 Tax=Acinetobacter thutiue TaxID=2998078 RepID=A0ABT7WLA8_9GAMM|nr:DUF2157 domain-containing protein [Acinetobacter thutiue]MCY6411326.1 DUF2157 domain-containing protein [Acinetobacter thutiue]MDN0013428.1 DUF2157 domain-containing protein [Acinetobacter thutiue]